MINLSDELIAISEIDPKSPIGISVRMLAEKLAKDEHRKRLQRERTRRYRNVTVTPTVTVTHEAEKDNDFKETERYRNDEQNGVYIYSSNILNGREISKKEVSKKVSRARARPVENGYQEFDAWYEKYPRKTARADAKKSYLRARKSASAEQILDGINRYNASISPDFDPQFHPYPATWLNRKRWEDDYPATPNKADAKPPSPHLQVILHNRKLFQDAADAERAANAAAVEKLLALGSPTPGAISPNANPDNSGIRKGNGTTDGQLFGGGFG